ncbi:MAG: hypothetical protein QOJ40_2175 [Verrucomicrobiota bacterium]
MNPKVAANFKGTGAILAGWRLRLLAMLAPFRTKLVLLMLLAVLPAFGLVFYGNLEQRRIEKLRVREAATATARLAAANEQNFINDARQLLGTLTQFPFLLLTTNRAFTEGNLANLRKLSPDYANFGLIETNGAVFCSAEPYKGPVDLSDRSYFQRVLKTKKFSMGNFQVGRLLGEPSLNVGYPVFDEKGQLQRVLFASLKLTRLSEAITNCSPPAGGTVMVIDRDGSVVASQPDPRAWVGKSLRETPVVKRMFSQRGNVFEMRGLDGVPRLHAITTISDGELPSLFICVAIPLKVSFARADEDLVRNIIILALVALGVWLAARAYANRSFLRPVNALSEAVNRLARGDFSARTGSAGGPAELVQLGVTFDEMANRLQTRQAEIERAHQEISSLNEALENRVAERTAQLEHANKELEAFSYSVSHDLRAPLRHIDGYVGRLTKVAGDKLDDKSKGYLKTISSAAIEMGQLIDNLLMFSRMGRVEMQQDVVDLNSMAQGAILGLQEESQGRNIIWKNGKFPAICGDPSLLRQVIINLLSNAVKYTRPRDPAEIEIGCASETAEEIVVRVRDNGVGFDMQYADRLFGVFQRLHRAEEFEGTGIGLANVRRIVQRHGGRTWAEGKEDGGASFYFSLPKVK